MQITKEQIEEIQDTLTQYKLKFEDIEQAISLLLYLKHNKVYEEVHGPLLKPEYKLLNLNRFKPWG